MAKKKRPSIEQFREFVKKHPHLRNEVKQKQATWQELFEEWYLLGESHPRWEVDQRGSESSIQKQSSAEGKQNESSSNQEWIGMVLGALKNMDINQIQEYIKSANQALGTVQGLIEMFQGSNTTKEESPTQNRETEQQESPEREHRKNPFLFRKD